MIVLVSLLLLGTFQATGLTDGIYVDCNVKSESCLELRLFGSEKTFAFESKPLITFDHLKSVSIVKGPFSANTLRLYFDDEGRKILKDHTTLNKGKSIGFVISNSLVSAPTIFSAIENGSFQLILNMEYEKCKEIAVKLKSKIKLG